MALPSPTYATYAEVAVDAPFRASGVYSYGVPDHVNLQVGQSVWVPFGRPVVPGFVVGLTTEAPAFGVKPIVDVVDREAALTPDQIALARWLAGEYVASLYEALALFQPPGGTPRSRPGLRLAGPIDPVALDLTERRIVRLVERAGLIERAAVLAAAGRGGRLLLERLIQRGILQEEPILRPATIRPRLDRVAWLDLNRDAVAAGPAGLTARQRDLLARLAELDWPLPERAAIAQTDATAARLQALVRRGLLTRSVEQVPVRRDPSGGRPPGPYPAPDLTPDQAQAVAAIAASLDVVAPGREPAVFLIQGVTGSGKTEVYLRALAETIARGRQGIVLVPEIALTPQMVDRFAGRFPGRVAVLHSRLSRGALFDEWHRTRSGAVDVVVGSRSAVFAPVPRLGLIVIDEEHEWTYKQHDLPPLYEARAVALKRAEIVGAAVVLGSATPDVVSRYQAEAGRYHLLRLPSRIGRARLPEVEIADLRAELRAGNRGIFSRALDRAVRTTLAAGEQVILFLNRRGAATFVQCRDCGQALGCRRCDVPFTFHQGAGGLICHRCNVREPVPMLCPACGSTRIKHFGLGTERLEELTRETFPEARVIRWDRDTTAGRDAHARLLATFRERRADILVGTQMIAKGLDLPDVTLVGVINADVGLYLPDYRAGERTFQLLAQVAGRAGRGARPGRVIVQTYTPDHPAIGAAAGHDVDAFYQTEIEQRRRLWNPPFSRLTRLVHTGTGAGSARRAAEQLADRLRNAAIDLNRPDLEVIGPAPGFVERVRGRYVWQIILRGDDPAPAVRRAGPPPGWRVDVDPASLL